MDDEKLEKKSPVVFHPDGLDDQLLSQILILLIPFLRSLPIQEKDFHFARFVSFVYSFPNKTTACIYIFLFSTFSTLSPNTKMNLRNRSINKICLKRKAPSKTKE